ncbi:hypothetical protein CVT24_007810 [Panaeolus cyanescens]|uniref:Uncharacterized protein n=1 Tax=Panaeolus cyanescens TaxID=181874 RepID=A0A409WZ30_9AGAR|nr:hypothetical protein CVT24_007810 [Panaeolus cyanescens]
MSLDKRMGRAKGAVGPGWGSVPRRTGGREGSPLRGGGGREGSPLRGGGDASGRGDVRGGSGSVVRRESIVGRESVRRDGSPLRNESPLRGGERAMSPLRPKLGLERVSMISMGALMGGAVAMRDAEDHVDDKYKEEEGGDGAEDEEERGRGRGGAVRRRRGERNKEREKDGERDESRGVTGSNVELLNGEVLGDDRVDVGVNVDGGVERAVEINDVENRELRYEGNMMRTEVDERDDDEESDEDVDKFKMQQFRVVSDVGSVAVWLGVEGYEDVGVEEEGDDEVIVMKKAGKRKGTMVIRVREYDECAGEGEDVNEGEGEGGESVPARLRLRLPLEKRGRKRGKWVVRDEKRMEVSSSSSSASSSSPSSTPPSNTEINGEPTITMKEVEDVVGVLEGWLGEMIMSVGTSDDARTGDPMRGRTRDEAMGKGKRMREKKVEVIVPHDRKEDGVCVVLCLLLGVMRRWGVDVRMLNDREGEGEGEGGLSRDVGCEGESERRDDEEGDVRSLLFTLVDNGGQVDVRSKKREGGEVDVDVDVDVNVDNVEVDVDVDVDEASVPATLTIPKPINTTATAIQTPITITDHTPIATLRPPISIPIPINTSTPEPPPPEPQPNATPVPLPNATPETHHNPTPEPLPNAPEPEPTPEPVAFTDLPPLLRDRMHRRSMRGLGLGGAAAHTPVAAGVAADVAAGGVADAADPHAVIPPHPHAVIPPHPHAVIPPPAPALPLHRPTRITHHALVIGGGPGGGAGAGVLRKPFEMGLKDPWMGVLSVDGVEWVEEVWRCVKSKSS